MIRSPRVKIGFFRRISGLAFERVSALAFETEDINRTAARPGYRSGLAAASGGTKWKNIVLKRSFHGRPILYNWEMARTARMGTHHGPITIRMLALAGKPLAGRTFVEGWLVKWELSSLDTARNEVAIETLGIAHPRA